MSEPVIRRATRSDVPALCDVYNHYILNTHVTFHVEPLSLRQRLDWFDQFREGGCHQCFAAVLDSETIGWACSTAFKNRAAYDASVETSVYLAPEFTGRGFGGRLYGTLMAALADAGAHRAYAFIAQPNPASVMLHERTGFACAGTYREVGRKFGRYWDVAVYERKMDSGP